MNNIEEYVLKFEKELKMKANLKSVDSSLLLAVTRACGDSIYTKDASIVSSSNKKELERVKKHFLIKKLGLKDGDYLDHGIQAVIDQLGKSNRLKFRPIFYYLLVKHFNASSKMMKYVTGEHTLERLANFGENLLMNQKDIDPEIRAVTDSNFSDLLS